MSKAKTLYDGIATGRYQNGDTSYQSVANKDGPKHVIIQGMTGSGKTEGEKPVILACAGRGANTIIVDVRKKTQSYGALAPALNWLIVDDGLARASFTRLIDHVIPARTEALANAGFGSWSPHSPLNFLRFQVEEAWDFMDEDALVEVSLAARSAGIQLILSVQRASHDLLNTSLRAQLGTVKCYGLKSGADSFVLSEEVEDAGANPGQWADEQPGMHYMEQGGLTIAQKIMPIRAFTDMGSVKFADVARTIAGQNLVRPLDVVTDTAWGEMWTKARKPLELMANVGTIVVQQKVVPPPAPPAPPAVDFAAARASVDNDSGEDDDMDDNDTTLTLVPRDPEEVTDSGRTVKFAGARPGEYLVHEDEDPDPDYIPDPDMVIDERPADRAEVRFGGLPAEKVSREEFDAAMDTLLKEYIDGGREMITAMMFTDVVVDTGWSRASVYRMLDVWTDEGRLARVDDGWMIVRH